jgi:hypothetical protein
VGLSKPGPIKKTLTTLSDFIVNDTNGNITFHTARGTAFPLPLPGSVPKPLPVVVEAAQLKKMLGLASVNYTETNHTLAIVDSTLG